MSIQGKDLTKEPPSSPRARVHKYAILARLADKVRAAYLGGNLGEYHTDCPLDHLLLDWKGIKYEALKKEIVGGANDIELANYLDAHGIPKSSSEVKAWSDSVESLSPYSDPDKRKWYTEKVSALGLEAKDTPMFSWLEADDRTLLVK